MESYPESLEGCAVYPRPPEGTSIHWQVQKTQDQKQGGCGVGDGPVLSFVHYITPPSVRAERDWVENLSGPILPVRKGNWSPEWRLCCLRSHSKSMVVPGFEPGSFDSWFSAPSMLLPWSSGKSENDMDAHTLG